MPNTWDWWRGYRRANRVIAGVIEVAATVTAILVILHQFWAQGEHLTRSARLLGLTLIVVAVGFLAICVVALIVFMGRDHRQQELNVGQNSSTTVVVNQTATDAYAVEQARKWQERGELAEAEVTRLTREVENKGSDIEQLRSAAEQLIELLQQRGTDLGETHGALVAARLAIDEIEKTLHGKALPQKLTLHLGGPTPTVEDVIDASKKRVDQYRQESGTPAAVRSPLSLAAYLAQPSIGSALGGLLGLPQEPSRQISPPSVPDNEEDQS